MSWRPLHRAIQAVAGRAEHCAEEVGSLAAVVHVVGRLVQSFSAHVLARLARPDATDAQNVVVVYIFDFLGAWQLICDC